MQRSAAFIARLFTFGVVLTASIVSHAEDRPVDVELILAIDSSDSINRVEYRVQRDGLADAFRDPLFHKAVVSGPNQAIAVLIFEWAGQYHQELRSDWRLIDSPEAALALADEINGYERILDNGVTSISGAIEFAISQYTGNGYDGFRKVLDISADGRHNQGRKLGKAREEALNRDITINGIAILSEMPDLNRYFEYWVIGGFGAFVEVARSHEDYPRAILAKLLREVRHVPLGSLPPTSPSTELAKGVEQ